MIKNIVSLSFFLVMTSFAWTSFAVEIPKPTMQELLDAMNQKLRDRLATQEEAVSYELRIINQDQTEAMLTSLNYCSINVDHVDLKQETKRFQAAIRCVPQVMTGKERQFTVNGTYESMVSVPVLTRAMQKGEVIGQGDITMKPVLLRSLSRSVIKTKEELQGYALKRAMRDGEVLQTQYIDKPILVERHAIVDIMFETPTMRLSTKGVAMDSGREGEAVHIKNISSQKEIIAKVIGNNKVAANLE